MMSAIAAEIDAVTGRENIVDWEDSDSEASPVKQKVMHWLVISIE